MAYAVGEMCKPISDKNDELFEDDRWYPTTWNTYEVVTAWVHPRLGNRVRFVKPGVH